MEGQEFLLVNILILMVAVALRDNDDCRTLNS